MESLLKLYVRDQFLVINFNLFFFQGEVKNIKVKYYEFNKKF